MLNLKMEKPLKNQHKQGLILKYWVAQGVAIGQIFFYFKNK